MTHTWIRRILPIVIIVVAILVGRGMQVFQVKPSQQSRPAPRFNVEVLTIQRGSIPLSINSQGTVSAKHQVEWASDVSGRVQWVAPEFVEGGVVAAGSTLIKIDSGDYRLALAEAEASLADAKLALTEEQNELRRAKLYRSNNQQSIDSSLRQPKLAQVEARYKAAEERVRQARDDLAATDIKASFAAVIDNKRVDIGHFVSPSTPLFNLLGTDMVEVRLPVTAADIGFINAVTEKGNSPQVALSASFGRQRHHWQGRLARIEQRVDTVTRTFFVVAEVSKPYDRTVHTAALAVGLFVDAEIEAAIIPDAVRIPRQALHDDRFVYLVEEGMLRRRQVKVLRQQAQQVIVSSGLSDGDLLVMTKLDLMLDGMEVHAMTGTGVTDKTVIPSIEAQVTPADE